MTAPQLRSDAALLDFDVPAALTAGLHGAAVDRARMLGDAALTLARLGVVAGGVRFLAGYVVSAGRAAAAALPEPLVGDSPAALAHAWLTATLDDPSVGNGAGPAVPDAGTIAADDLVGQWLRNVADLLELRARAGVAR